MRTRVVVGIAAGVVVAGSLVAVAVPVVRSSDVANTELRVATDNPLPPETAPLPDTVRPLWTRETTHDGASVEGPTAVVTGADRVAGLDPATGRERWSYRRGNARLCDTSLRDGVVLALFAKSHGCRDLIGLDAANGDRRWFRTVEFTADAGLTSGPGVAVVTGADKMIAVDTGSGLNRWTWTEAGCRLDPATVGRAAVATVARCRGEDRLVVHDPYADRAPSVAPQPAGTDPRVVAADEEVSVLERVGGTPALTGYRPREGAGNKQEAVRTGSVRDARLAYAAGGPLAAVTDSQAVVLWTGQRVVAVDVRSRQVRWTAAASGPPVLAEGQVLMVEAGGFTARPVLTGTPAVRVPVSGGTLPAGGTLSRLGRLVLSSTPARLTAFG